MFIGEIQHLVVQESQVRGNYKLEVSLCFEITTLCDLDNVANTIKIE